MAGEERVRGRVRGVDTGVELVVNARLSLAGPSSIQILAYGVRKESAFIFLYRYAFVPTPCFEWTVLLLEIY